MVSASTSITTLAAVIDLAIAMEKHGRNYYSHARDKTTDPKCKKFFSWLVEQEDDHHQTYLRLLGDTAGTDTSRKELSGGYGHFVEILVKEVTESLQESEKLSLDEAIEQALFFEESVINYFQKVKRLFPEEQSILIQQICDEEQQHIDAITKFRSELEV